MPKGLDAPTTPPHEALLRLWLASFRSRPEAWTYFTQCDAPGLRIEGDDYYGWTVTARNLDAERVWGIVGPGT